MLSVGVASRPLPGFAVNGDRCVIEQNGSELFIAVIDGLGHGEPAAEASEIAVECLRSCGNSHESFYHLCHEKLLRSRGVVIATFLIDDEKGLIEYTGVGNIEASVCLNGLSEELFWKYGILGTGVTPKVHLRQAPFPSGSLLIIHSDGISSRFKLDDYYGLAEQPAQFIAEVLLRDWGRANDDATVVVVRREEDSDSGAK